jgi:hypothetical protein
LRKAMVTLFEVRNLMAYAADRSTAEEARKLA